MDKIFWKLLGDFLWRFLSSNNEKLDSLVELSDAILSLSKKELIVEIVGV